MRSVFSELINFPLSPVTVKLVIDVAADINVLNTSHIGVISVCGCFQVRIKGKGGYKEAKKQTIVGSVK